MDNEIPELLILAASRETLGLREESCVLLVAFALRQDAGVFGRAGLRSHCWDTAWVDGCVLDALKRSRGGRRRKC